jgi:hypothetical protein
MDTKFRVNWITAFWPESIRDFFNGFLWGRLFSQRDIFGFYYWEVCIVQVDVFMNQRRKDNFCLLSNNRNRRHTVSNVTSERRNLVGQLAWVLTFRSVIRLVHAVLRAVTSLKLPRTDMQTRSNSAAYSVRLNSCNSVAITFSCVLKNQQVLMILHSGFFNSQPVYSTDFRINRCGGGHPVQSTCLSFLTIINSIVIHVNVVIHYKFMLHVSVYCGHHRVYRNTNLLEGSKTANIKF